MTQLHAGVPVGTQLRFPEGRAGLLAVTDGGTLFPDEIAELPGVLQFQPLRAHEDVSIHRVGSQLERRMDVQLIAA